MGLDDDLCQRAKDLYGWDMKFEGELVDLSQIATIEIKKWIIGANKPSIAVASLPLEGNLTYGFVSPVNPTVYHPCATIFRGRENDYQEDMIRHLLLHVRKAEPREPTITFPASFSEYIWSHHLFLLRKDNQEVRKFQGETAILEVGNLESYAAGFERCRIETRSKS